MITAEKILAAALRDRRLMDTLGEALSSDLVTANPALRRIAEFANDFAGEHRRTPGADDWQAWLSSLPERQRDGTKEVLGRVLAADTSELTPEFFGERVLEELRTAAARTALSRLNTIDRDRLAPESFLAMAGKVERVTRLGWGDPAPLVDDAPAPLPLDAFPAVIRRHVVSVAGATQTPPDMAALLCLAALSVAAQGKARVRPRSGWSEPVNIYAVVIQPPAGRKSAVFREIFAPLEAHEIELTKREIPKREEAIARREALRKRYEKLLRHSALDEDHDDHVPLEMVEVARAQLLDAKVPALSRLNAQDVTPEALVPLMAEQGGRLAIWSPEGDPLSIFGGRYSDRGANFDALKKAWSGGESIRVDRISRDAQYVRNPTLTLALTLQPAFLSSLRNRDSFVGEGVLGRILWAFPDAALGSRKTGRHVPGLDADAAAAWEGLLERLLAATPKDVDEEDQSFVPHGIELSPDALDVLYTWEAEVERELGPGRQLRGIDHWSGKLVGNTIRIAALLHLAKLGGDPASNLWGTPISGEVMESAVRLGTGLVAHAQKVFAALGRNRKVVLGEYVLERAVRLAQEEGGSVTLSRLHQASKDKQGLGTVGEVEAVVRLLAEHNLVRIRKRAAEGPGRPPSPIVEIHPEIIRDGGRRP